MQIGSSFPIVNAPGRKPGQSSVNGGQQQQAAEAQTTTDKSPQRAADYSDYIAAAEQNQRSSESGFFNMDRTLSFRGQEALTTYLTNAEFQWNPPNGQLVGVDVYV